ncbi:MAG: hypothetical protein PVI86_08340 [Phycisphaerae bacterium]|jgi:hypothetical protein
MRRCAAFVSVSLLLGWSTAVYSWRGSDAGRTDSSAAATVLRVARSADGLRFVDTGEVFLKRATAPDMIVLEDGEVLAVFDYAVRGRAGGTVLALSRSSDGGRSWSRARPIRFNGAKGRATGARHGDLVRTEDGRVRVHFTTAIEPRRKSHRRRTGHLAVVRAAERRGDVDFRFDPRVKIRVASGGDVHPMSVLIDKQLHLYVADLGGHTGRSSTRLTRIRHLVSGDGRSYSRLRSTYVRKADFAGSIVSLGDGFRAYASTSEGVVSLVSDDVRRWRLERGVRVREGWDPAVARLTDGSYLMLYCAEMDDASLSSTAIVEAPIGEWTDKSGGSDDGVLTGEGDATAAGGSGGEASETVADGAGEAEGAPVAGAEGDGTGAVEAGPESEGELIELVELTDYWDPIASDGFAPLPDFVHRIDYFEWYAQYALGRPADNAFDAYMKIMPDPYVEDGWEPYKRMFNNMFTGKDAGAPGPWDAAGHPEWETSRRQVRHLLDGFREASRYGGYASPPMTKQREEGTGVDDAPTLYHLILPSLAGHRHLSKATLADAWRVDEEGRVSSERMLDAFETTLRAANHLEQGPTIIEDLVSLAERRLVEENARWALERDVFSVDELETTLETLREHDRIDRGFELSMRGEHAFSMDIMQHMFSPPTSEGLPQFNRKRTEDVFDFSDKLLDGFAGMTPDDVYNTIDAMDASNRELDQLMGIGYPDVRAADVDGVYERYRETSPITEEFVPSFGRYYQVKAQTEASRRATQLAYETHLYKARTGRWPKSLDELSVGYGTDVRIDPFTGDYFGYRLTDDGPQIYSASENGIDDGGVHSSSWGRTPDNDAASDDYVFWPPQAR